MSNPGTPRTPTDLLVLHIVRVVGFADDALVARRSGLDLAVVSELLEDYQAYGWVTHAQFADTVGWSLTERGRVEDGKRLAEELAATSAREIVELAYQAFQPLNQRLVRACTDWQLRPQGGDPLAANDHTDPIWEARVLDELSAVDSELGGLIDQLANPLPRFGDYHHRFSTALARARAGELHWVAGVGVPSCHSVWMQLHEDLLSTLGVSRAEELG